MPPKAKTPKKSSKDKEPSAGGIDQDKVSQVVKVDNRDAQAFIDFYTDIEDPV
jgi:hypothetical protein